MICVLAEGAFYLQEGGSIIFVFHKLRTARELPRGAWEASRGVLDLRPFFYYLEVNPMGAGPNRPDGSVDAIAAITIITVVVVTLSVWLSGMPS